MSCIKWIDPSFRNSYHKNKVQILNYVAVLQSFLFNLMGATEVQSVYKTSKKYMYVLNVQCKLKQPIGTYKFSKSFD